jgi:hypothetical protein
LPLQIVALPADAGSLLLAALASLLTAFLSLLPPLSAATARCLAFGLLYFRQGSRLFLARFVLRCQRVFVTLLVSARDGVSAVLDDFIPRTLDPGRNTGRQSAWIARRLDWQRISERSRLELFGRRGCLVSLRATAWQSRPFALFAFSESAGAAWSQPIAQSWASLVGHWNCSPEKDVAPGTMTESASGKKR